MSQRICHLQTTPTGDGNRITKAGYVWFGEDELIGATGGSLEVYESSAVEAVRVLPTGGTEHTPGPLAWVSITRPGEPGGKAVSAFVTLGAAGMTELHDRVGTWLELHGGPDR